MGSSMSPQSNQIGRKTLWAWTISTSFGVGLGKPGPGTWGSVATVLLWSLYAWLIHPSPQALLFALAALIGFALILGIPAATIVARESARKDPQFVVIDEVAGQAITLLFSPFDLRHGLLATQAEPDVLRGLITSKRPDCGHSTGNNKKHQHHRRNCPP